MYRSYTAIGNMPKQVRRHAHPLLNRYKARQQRAGSHEAGRFALNDLFAFHTADYRRTSTALGAKKPRFLKAAALTRS